MKNENMQLRKINNNIRTELGKVDYYKQGWAIVIYKHGYYGHAWLPNDYNRDDSDGKITFYWLAYDLSRKYKCVYFVTGDDIWLSKVVENGNCVRIIDTAFSDKDPTFVIETIKNQNAKIVFLDEIYLDFEETKSIINFCKKNNVTIFILSSMSRSVAHRKIEQGYNASIELEDINVQKELNLLADYVFAIDYSDCYQLKK